MTSVRVNAFTHQGRVRESNEDALTVNDWVRSAPMDAALAWSFPFGAPLMCAVVDGMGGHAAGEVASRHAAMHLADTRRFFSAEDAIAQLQQINSEIYEAMATAPERRGMGAVVAGLYVEENRLIWFNVGDARVYRVRDGYLRQISIDDAPSVGRSHFITQALGGGERFTAISPHAGAEALPVGSRWLLCSDGLTDMLDATTIEACLEHDDGAAVNNLFQEAMAAGGMDNISIIVVNIGVEENKDDARNRARGAGAAQARGEDSD